MANENVNMRVIQQAVLSANRLGQEGRAVSDFGYLHATDATGNDGFVLEMGEPVRSATEG